MIEEQKKITVIMKYKHHTKDYKCDENVSLEAFVNDFAKLINVDHSSLYALYGRNSLFSEDFKKPISEIIKPLDKNAQMMTLLFAQNTLFAITDQDVEIIIFLSIESVKQVILNGKKGEAIRNIIGNSSVIEFDLKWCIFKYKEKEIDLNKKFDDIANDNDKKELKLNLTLTYTIPLIVNIVNEKNEKYRIQCLLKDTIEDKIDSYFQKYNLNRDDYDIFYENKIIINNDFTIFYEIISGNNRFPNTKKNNNENCITINETLEDINSTKINDKQIKDKVKSVLPNNEGDETKLEVEIQVIKKACFFLCDKRISKCCDRNKGCLKKCGIIFLGMLVCRIFLILLADGWRIYIF